MSNQLSSKIALAYTGTNATNPPNIYLRNRAPTSNDFQNVSIGDFWVYRVNRTSNNNLLYVLMGLVGNVANWVLLSNNTGVTTNLTGNTGGLVAPSMGNINVVGDGTTITITGDPLTHTLTASLIGGGAAIDTIIPNSGINVVPDGSGNVSIVGGNNITTVGTANTLTLNVSGTTNHAVQVGNATGSLTSLGVGTDGQVLVGATGANPAFATLTSSNSSITFTPGPNSLSLQTSGTNAQSFHTDSGDATPSSGVLNILGSGIISTSGVGNTVTIASAIPAYATGTFTPTLTFGGGSTGITYAVGQQIGKYTQIGNVVHFSIFLTLTNKGSDTGSAQLNGLPVASGTNNLNTACYASPADLTLDAGYTVFAPLIGNGSTSIVLREYGSGTGSTGLTDANFTNNTNLNVAGTYFTD